MMAMICMTVLLPYVMEFNAGYTGEKFREIARMMGVADGKGWRL